MKYKVDISHNADNDLRCIYKYIAYELCSFENASSLLGRLQDAILSLDEMPKRNRLYDKEPWKSRCMRFIPVSNFIIFYIPDDEKMTVTVTRVMYGGRNIEEQLNK